MMSVLLLLVRFVVVVCEERGVLTELVLEWPGVRTLAIDESLGLCCRPVFSL
jgi:hypothetical protein